MMHFICILCKMHQKALSILYPFFLILLYITCKNGLCLAFALGTHGNFGRKRAEIFIVYHNHQCHSLYYAANASEGSAIDEYDTHCTYHE